MKQRRPTALPERVIFIACLCIIAGIAGYKVSDWVRSKDVKTCVQVINVQPKPMMYPRTKKELQQFINYRLKSQ
jgi:hypothetical protein